MVQLGIRRVDHASGFAKVVVIVAKLRYSAYVAEYGNGPRRIKTVQLSRKGNYHGKQKSSKTQTGNGNAGSG